ncbi:MAG: hypothetical protein KAI86_08900, partial [Desulfobacterales bacterium]|nr:hypothetical protein [Desulfobacterales bacterium]
MDNSPFSNLAKAFGLIIILVAVVFLVNFAVDQDGSEEIMYEINASEAVIIVAQNQIAQDYMSENFNMPEWRAVKTSLLMNSTDGVEHNETYPLWDVKIMERT